MDVLFAGLGSMGIGMATSLLRAGHTVHGVDTDSARRDMLRAEGGTQDMQQADALVSAVLNAAQTRMVLFGPDGLADRLRPGAVILSCATVAPDFAREMEAKAHARGLRYLDAPISGGAAKAAEGRLSIMASGRPDAFEAAAPVLEAMAETVHDLGDTAGVGSAMKAVNQLLAGVHIAAMGEAMGFAASQGLDLGQVVRVIAASAGQSFMFDNRAPHVVEADYAPRSKVDIWLKDLGIVTEIATASGLPLPVMQEALTQFHETSKAGLGDEDDAAIAKHVAHRAGVKLPGSN
jgi:3-hydroxyisobutyrate dehydrogenase/2-hydroxy-3-oxopropionate reductase